MNDALRLLADLLKVYSPTGSEAAAANFLLSEIQALGFEAWCDEAGNVIGRRGRGPNDILLLGHIDTVPGEITVRQEGSRLYGRGAVDAKGPLACFVAAAAAARLSPDWQITVIGAVGEEGDSRGAQHLCRHYPPPAMVLVGEPSGWNRVTLGYKGSLWCHYQVCTPLAHTAAAKQSACEQAVDFWNALQSTAAHFNQDKERAFEQLTPTLRAFKSHEDGFSEQASLRIGLRLPPGMSYPEIETLLNNLAGNGSVTIEDFLPAHKAEKNTPLVRSLLAAVRSAGAKPAFSLKTGTADMNLVGPAWNCPTVAYGPGDSNLDHTPHEHILIEEYLSAIHVLTQALEHIMTTEASS